MGTGNVEIHCIRFNTRAWTITLGPEHTICEQVVDIPLMLALFHRFDRYLTH